MFIILPKRVGVKKMLMACEMAQQVNMQAWQPEFDAQTHMVERELAASICALTSTGTCGTNSSVYIHKSTKHLTQKLKKKRMLKCVHKQVKLYMYDYVWVL